MAIVADMKQRRGKLTIPSSQEQAREDGFKIMHVWSQSMRETREDFEAAVSEGPIYIFRNRPLSHAVTSQEMLFPSEK